jgi:hypothetical protein
MRTRPGALRTCLVEDLITAGLCSRGEHGDRESGDVERPGPLIGRNDQRLGLHSSVRGCSEVRCRSAKTTVALIRCPSARRWGCSRSLILALALADGDSLPSPAVAPQSSPDEPSGPPLALPRESLPGWVLFFGPGGGREARSRSCGGFDCFSLPPTPLGGSSLHPTTGPSRSSSRGCHSRPGRSRTSVGSASRPARRRSPYADRGRSARCQGEREEPREGPLGPDVEAVSPAGRPHGLFRLGPIDSNVPLHHDDHLVASDGLNGEVIGVLERVTG